MSGKTGRPSEFTEEMGALICQRIASGESVRAICRDDDMPGERTVFGWLSRFDNFAQQYARAMEARTHALAEEIISIADDSHGDILVDEDGNERTNHEVVARAKLRVDTRKWLMSKLAPKKYGERLDMNVAGSLQTIPDEALDARITQLLGKAGTGKASDGEGEA